MDVYPGRDCIYQVDHTGPGRNELRYGGYMAVPSLLLCCLDTMVSKYCSQTR